MVKQDSSRIRLPRTSHDMKRYVQEEAERRRRAALRQPAPKHKSASNDEPVQPPRSNIALLFSSVTLNGTQQQAVFFNPQSSKTKTMDVGRVVKNLQDSYRAATKPIALDVKDKPKAAARRKTSLENGDAYYEAARQMNALEGVQPRMVVRFFRRRAKHLLP